jgi:sterol desaturase/sphingolipid hydroxylase (fatty acid hydroxylase superfamily)
MTLTDRHRHFLLIEQGLVPVIFNFLLNGLIVWALFRTVELVPLWGKSSVGIDLLVTGFVLPFLTCLIVSTIVSRDFRAGKIPAIPNNQLPLSKWFQRSLLVRGLFLGILGVIFAAAPIVWALDLGQAQPLAVSSFILFKAVWAALLAMVFTPIVGWWALANASRTSDIQ